jgi:hypothetical protein
MCTELRGSHFDMQEVIIQFLSYCDGYGVCYATASKVRVTSDVNIASQRLGIPRQPNC